MKISVDQQFLKYSKQPIRQQQPFHVQSHLNPLYSPFWCLLELQQVLLTTSRCPNALSCCHVIGWLAICVTKQLNRCYLIKCPLSVCVCVWRWISMQAFGNTRTSMQVGFWGAEPVEWWRAGLRWPFGSHSPNRHCAWLSRFFFPCCDAGTWSCAYNRRLLIALNDWDTLTLYTEGRQVQLTPNVL